MSKTTENLDLFEYDTQTDGKQKFNINKALNENFDKIDAAFKGINNKADIDLNNLSTVGQTKFDQKASIDLSNLSAVGQAILDRKVEVEALLEQNGYAKFTWKENNKVAILIIQWGKVDATNYAGVVTFPIGFNSVSSILSNAILGDADTVTVTAGVLDQFTTPSGTLIRSRNTNHKSYWLAIGY